MSPTRRDIPFFKRFIRDFLAAHKLNTIFLEVGAGMRFRRHPELNEGAVEFARDILARWDNLGHELIEFFPERGRDTPRMKQAAKLQYWSYKPARFR